MAAAELFVDLLLGYVLAGAVFAALFVTIGIARVDPAAEHAPVGFRLIVMPGVTALWPYLLWRWMRSKRP